jgi:hypothetical protein
MPCCDLLTGAAGVNAARALGTQVLVRAGEEAVSTVSGSESNGGLFVMFPPLDEVFLGKWT